MNSSTKRLKQSIKQIVNNISVSVRRYYTHDQEIFDVYIGMCEMVTYEKIKTLVKEFQLENNRRFCFVTYVGL